MLLPRQAPATATPRTAFRAAQPKGPRRRFSGSSRSFLPPCPPPHRLPQTTVQTLSPCMEFVAFKALYKHWLISRAAPRHQEAVPSVSSESQCQSLLTKTSFSHKANGAPQPRSLCLKKKEEGRRETLPLASTSPALSPVLAPRTRRAEGCQAQGSAIKSFCPLPRALALPGSIVAGAGPPADWHFFLHLPPEPLESSPPSPHPYPSIHSHS